MRIPQTKTTILKQIHLIKKERNLASLFPLILEYNTKDFLYFDFVFPFFLHIMGLVFG